MRLGAALIALAGCLSVHALQKITKTGKYLYGEDGNRFYIKVRETSRVSEDERSMLMV